MFPQQLNKLQRESFKEVKQFSLDDPTYFKESEVGATTRYSFLKIQINQRPEKYNLFHDDNLNIDRNAAVPQAGFTELIRLTRSSV